MLRSGAMVVAIAAAAAAAAPRPAASQVKAANALVTCHDLRHGTSDLRSKPRSCVFADPDDDGLVISANSFVVIHLRWKTWGGSIATATGTYAGNMGVRIRARVKLSKPFRCPDGGTTPVYQQADISKLEGSKLFGDIHLDRPSCDTE